MKNIFVKLVVCALSIFLSVNYARSDDALNFERMLVYAQKGDAEAGYHVGMMYQIGLGTNSNLQNAFMWFEKAAAAGDPLAEYKVGCYYAGQGTAIGIAVDFEKALAHKLVAAKAGYQLAQMDVAKMYNAKADLLQAEFWKEKATAQQRAPSELTSQAKLGKDRIGQYLTILDVTTKILKDTNQIQGVNAR